MKIPYEWLRAYCAPDLDLDTLAERLTVTGTKVNAIANNVIELEITANRPDCLGIYGVAREVHAATGARLAAAPWADEDIGTPGTVADLIVTVDAPALCPRFTARVFDDVHVGPSPRWMRDRLVAAGYRTINNVVDIGNYAMLLTGHPLNAFDLDHVTGERLTVRRAHESETIVTVDGARRALGSDMPVAADRDGPIAIGGIIAGARCAVREHTTRVVMESSSWTGPDVMRTAAILRCRTDASSRFAKGLAPEQAIDAQCVLTRLMVELAKARLRPGTIDVVHGPCLTSSFIRLRLHKVGRLLGSAISPRRARFTLEALGFDVTDIGNGELEVNVPPYRRNDVVREVNLIEEIGRFALADLPATLPRS